MQKFLRVQILLLTALILLGGLFSSALAAARPTGVVISANAYVGSAEELETAGVDAILDMANGKRLSLSALVLPQDASQRVRWYTSDRKVATVSSSGVVTAKKRGTVTIRAVSRSDSDFEDTFTIKIIHSDLPDQITLNASTLHLYRFDTFQLEPTVLPASAKQGVAYKSSRSSVASVSKTGLITAKKAGKVTITCYSTADKSILATVSLTVTQKASPTTITLTPADTAMVVGSTLQLTASPYPSNACEHFTFKSSSSRIASVDANGLITAKKTGKVTITVTSRQNTRIRIKREILVVSPTSPLSIVPESNEITLYTGSTMPLAATAYPLDKSQEFTYKSSSTRILSVSSNGMMTAKKAGKVTVTIASAVNSGITTKVTVRVENLPAPSSLTLSPALSSLCIGNQVQLSVTPSPAGTSAAVDWKSSSSSIASVSDSGVVSARKPGVVTITATSTANKKVTASFRLVVFHPEAPTSITLPSSVMALETSQTYELKPVLLPAGSRDGLSFTSNNSRVASVSSEGVITGRKAGSALITVTSSYNPAVSISMLVSVANRAAPTAISASLSENVLMVGETATITAAPVPASASRMFTYSSSSSQIASVSKDGVVTAKKAGTVTITVTSKKKSSVKATFRVTVYTDDSPRSVSLNTVSAYLTEDDSLQLTPSVLPASAYQKVAWKSSNTAVASVSSSGLITAQGAGTATITCTTLKGGLTASCQVQVLSTTLSTVIPARTTDIAGIPENLNKIEALRKSTVRQINLLKTTGALTASEATLRIQIVNRAFAMQAFPWMTLNTQEYWSKAYASKRYLPGYVYYGLPYIQTSASGTYLNRRYDVTKALSENRYKDSGYGYYVLNQNNLLEKMYCGNDCSSFVSMSLWGTSHAASYYNTVSMAKSTYYKTLSSYSELRPGDFLIKSGSHTVMFLYFTNTEKTRMMIIEQGGNGNTIICSEFDISYFLSKGYIARRRATFAN